MDVGGGQKVTDNFPRRWLFWTLTVGADRYWAAPISFDACGSQLPLAEAKSAGKNSVAFADRLAV